MWLYDRYLFIGYLSYDNTRIGEIYWDKYDECKKYALY